MDHRRLLHTGFCAALALGSASAAAVDVTGAMTADNHYALYHGREDGSGLAYIGRNEDGTTGNPGTWNFSEPENWSFEVAVGDRLYVVAWDDGGPQMLLGNFTWAGSQLIVTDTTSWEYFVPAVPTVGFSASGASPIAVADLGGLIASATLSSRAGRHRNRPRTTPRTTPRGAPSAACIPTRGSCGTTRSTTRAAPTASTSSSAASRRSTLSRNPKPGQCCWPDWGLSSVRHRGAGPIR